MTAANPFHGDRIFLQEESKDDLIEEMLRLREALKQVEQENEDLLQKIESAAVREPRKKRKKR